MMEATGTAAPRTIENLTVSNAEVARHADPHCLRCRGRGAVSKVKRNRVAVSLCRCAVRAFEKARRGVEIVSR